MAVSAEFKELLLEAFGPLGPVRIRGMFGGAGIFHGEVMFGLIAGETLYLKADDGNRGVFEAEDMGPFVYESPRGKRVPMPYWQAPDRLLDDVDELRRFGAGAVEAALRAARAKPTRRAAQPAAAKAAAARPAAARRPGKGR